MTLDVDPGAALAAAEPGTAPADQSADQSADQPADRPAAPRGRADAARESRADAPAWGIRVTAPSRLSFTLIDLNGQGGRRNGIACLALRDPSFQVAVSPAARTSLTTDEASAGYAEAIRSYLRILKARWRGPAVRAAVERGVPSHEGLGSKTTTLVGVGMAYAALCGRETSARELARLAGRGGTSGGSTNLFEHGGFIVDDGHANPPDFDADPLRYLRPSRFAVTARVPAALVHLRFPPWPILLITTVGAGLEGPAELEWFHRIVPMPAAEAHKTAHAVFMNLGPAIAEGDYAGFCRAVNTITYETYYKRHQIAAQAPAVQELIRAAARRPDIDAFGMSGMGPTCFAFTRRPRGVLAWLAELQERGVVRSCRFTHAQNHPATIDPVPICEPGAPLVHQPHPLGVGLPLGVG